MKITQFFAALVIVIFCCTVACAFTASYEQTTSGPGLLTPQSRLVKIKDNKVWMEMEGPQGRGIVIMDGATMYSYNPSTNTAVKLKNPVTAYMNVLSDYASYLKSLNAKLVGSETVGPYDCDTYEFIDPRVNVPSRVWLWKAYEFPVKVEMKVPTGVMTTIMKDVKVGINIDDSEFMLPPGVKIIDEKDLSRQ